MKTHSACYQSLVRMIIENTRFHLIYLRLAFAIVCSFRGRQSLSNDRKWRKEIQWKSQTLIRKEKHFIDQRHTKGDRKTWLEDLEWRMQTNNLSFLIFFACVNTSNILSNSEFRMTNTKNVLFSLALNLIDHIAVMFQCAPSRNSSTGRIHNSFRRRVPTSTTTAYTSEIVKSPREC